MVRRLVLVLAVLGLALGSATSASADPAARQAQTVTFTSTPPTDADWFDGATTWGVGYAASAEATSGLPVTHSVDPASAGVCSISEDFNKPTAPTWGGVVFLGPGTCTVLADQAGDATYLPAAQVSQSFFIDRVQPTMSGLKGRKIVPGVPSASFSATLLVPINISSHETGLWGYQGQVVTFSVAGRPACSGTTNSYGVATCTAPLPLLTWLGQLRFTASYAGDALYKPVTASQAFIG
jgi:hypothetical protein